VLPMPPNSRLFKDSKIINTHTKKPYHHTRPLHHRPDFDRVQLFMGLLITANTIYGRGASFASIMRSLTAENGFLSLRDHPRLGSDRKAELPDHVTFRDPSPSWGTLKANCHERTERSSKPGKMPLNMLCTSLDPIPPL
jgi:hypothetical protein